MLFKIVNNIFIVLYSVQILTMIVHLDVDQIQIVDLGHELIYLR